MKLEQPCFFFFFLLSSCVVFQIFLGLHVTLSDLVFHVSKYKLLESFNKPDSLLFMISKSIPVWNPVNMQLSRPVVLSWFCFGGPRFTRTQYSTMKCIIQKIYHIKINIPILMNLLIDLELVSIYDPFLGCNQPVKNHWSRPGDHAVLNILNIVSCSTNIKPRCWFSQTRWFRKGMDPL